MRIRCLLIACHRRCPASHRYGAGFCLVGGLVFASAVTWAQTRGSPQIAPLDIPWGTRVEIVSQRFALSPVDTTSEGTLYYVDVAEWNGVRLKMCELEFTQGCLSGAFLIASGESNSQLLLKELRKEFGPPAESDPRGHQWFTRDVHITLDEEAGGDGYLYWYYIPLQHERGTRHPPAKPH